MPVPLRTGIAPTDVVLDEHNVVQPDVFVVRDSAKVGERAITGAPDLVIEVVSPATEVVVTLGMEVKLWEIFEKDKPREEGPEGEE